MPPPSPPHVRTNGCLEDDVPSHDLHSASTCLDAAASKPSGSRSGLEGGSDPSLKCKVISPPNRQEATHHFCSPETSARAYPAPDRITFTHPEPAKQSPFDHYKITAAPQPRFSSIKAACQRMGISETEMESNASREINDLLQEIEDNRRRELSPPAMEPEPATLAKVLSKEDYLQIFRSQGYPVTDGPLMSIYCWAADLGRTRFNFDMELKPENIQLRNAYD